MQRLNSPVSVRLSDIQGRMNKRKKGQRGKVYEFNVSTEYAHALLEEQGIVNDFYDCPSAWHLDRIDPLKGYVEGNLQWLTAMENAVKSADDRSRHENYRLDEEHGNPF